MGHLLKGEYAINYVTIRHIKLVVTTTIIIIIIAFVYASYRQMFYI